MDEQTRTVLDSAADEVLDMAERLIGVGEMLDKVIEVGDEAEAADRVTQVTPHAGA